jgi:hypothetical protein
MNSRDTLEKYFRDNLQEIQVAPEPELWLSISSRINKKEKHRSVFYFWFEKFGNIAASFFVMFSLFHFEKNKSTLDLENNEVATTATKPSSVSNNNFTTVTQGHNAPISKVDKQYGDNEAEEGILSAQKTFQKSLTSSDKEVSIVQKEKKAIIKTENIINNEDTSLAFSSLPESSFKKYTNTIAAKPITLALLETINPLTLIALSEKKEKDKKNKKLANNSDKWIIGVNAIPNLIADNSKSSISNDFENKSETNSEVNYGLSLGYRLTKKINLRTGLNKTNTTDNVNNVSYLFSPANTSLATNPEALQLHSSQGNLILGNNAQFFAETANAISDLDKGTVVLDLSYFEIPFEILYNVKSGKNFNINTITGLSTFLLERNQAQLKTSSNEVIASGKSNNVNEQYFAINLGLGMNHKIFKNLYFQFEPIIKYHISPFKKEDKNYNPKTINFSTGICYSF